MDDETKQYFSLLKSKADVSAGVYNKVKQSEYYQRYKVKRGLIENPIYTENENSFQMDTMFYPLRGVLRPVFCAIEMTTRWGFMKPYKGDKLNAIETVDMIKDLQKVHTVEHLCCDPGSEYNNTEVKRYCNDNGIELYIYDTHELTTKSLVERFNKTVREYLNRYVETISPDWRTHTNEIMKAYNDRVNRNLKHSPNELEASQVLRQQLRDNILKKSMEYKSYLARFQPGLKVRVAEAVNPELTMKQLIKEEAFNKSGAIWTKKIYTIKEVDGYKIKLDGVEKRRYSPRDLQIVTGDIFQHEKQAEAVPERVRKERRKSEHLLREIDAPLDTSKLTEGRKTRKDGPVDQSYEVEKILGHKVLKGKYLFIVKWKGYSDKDNTNEPLKNLIDDDGTPNEYLQQYLEKHPRLLDKLIKSS
jgi:hypothetical protein